MERRKGTAAVPPQPTGRINTVASLAAVVLFVLLVLRLVGWLS